MPTRIAMHAAARAGTMTMLKDCAADAGIPLATYRARPVLLTPPHAFIDSINETMSWFAGNNFQRLPVVSVIGVWGLFDSGTAVDQRDAFLDAFYAWVAERPHAFDGNAMVDPVDIDDLPAWVPDWVEPRLQRVYYASRIRLRGFAAT